MAQPPCPSALSQEARRRLKLTSSSLESSSLASLPDVKPPFSLADDVIGNEPLRIAKRARDADELSETDAFDETDQEQDEILGEEFGVCSMCQASPRRLLCTQQRQPLALPSNALGNPFEQVVLERVLSARQMSVPELFEECLTRAVRGQMRLLIGGAPPPRQWPRTREVWQLRLPICDECFSGVFASLAYQFREQLPVEALPSSISNRENCWYGHECRTQRHNPQHAARLNHICERSRRRRALVVD